jgi:hypothetical protein
MSDNLQAAVVGIMLLVLLLLAGTLEATDWVSVGDREYINPNKVDISQHGPQLVP